MRVQLLDLDLLDARADARAVDGDKVRAIAASVGDVGLLNPIRVRPAPGAEGRFEIVAGMHRVAAYRALGLVEIEADVVDSGDLFAELAMIDENLCRAELGPADRARQVARRKAIYEELHPETRPTSEGGEGRRAETRRQLGDELAPRFTADTAAATGASERTVQREAERGEKISPDVLELVRGTELDTGTFLDKLKKFSPDQQRMLVERELEVLERSNPNAHRSTMHRRVEPDDSLHYFPTPPWATRALMEVVLPQLGWAPNAAFGLLSDPACGEGHITGVLAEYVTQQQVVGTDIFNYSLDGRSPPGWAGVFNFLAPDLDWEDANWIITNPPFGAVTLPFILKALRLARVGVAMLVRQQWLEGVNRFRDLFELHPPALIGQFVERVPIHKGRWEPEGDTLTSYVWIVWVKAPGVTLKNGDTRFFWIPDGQRDALSKPDDVARFTAHPVLGPDTSSTAARKDVLDNSTEDAPPAALLDQAAASTPPAGTQAPPVEAFGADEITEQHSPEGASEEGGSFPVAAAPHESGATGGDEGDQTSQPANVGGFSDVAAGETEPSPAVAALKHQAAPDAPASAEAVVVAPARPPQPGLPLTREACRPILEARYRSEPTEVLSAETGVPVNTLRTWAHRLGLTSKARIRDSGKAWAAALHGKDKGGAA